VIERDAATEESVMTAAMGQAVLAERSGAAA